MFRFILFVISAFAISSAAISQKMVHIPLYLQDINNNDGSQFSWNKTAQSANFILIWGNTVGTNPVNYPDPNLAFNPTAILDTMEYIYTAFKQLGFVDDAPGTKLSQYKVPVVIYGTWGANGAQGWANGGDADGVVGAFWAHPNAMHDGGVAAHEFAHSMQAQSVIDYRATNGFGPVWNNAGIFWETHANFMRNLLYPKAVTAWGMDVYHLETWGDWKNTYENYELVLAIMESEGIDMVNRLWRESFSNEYPLQAYKRLAGYNQARFNDSLYHYARRMATFDFSYNNIGKYFRQYRNADLTNYLPSIQNTFSVLKKIPGSSHRYEMPIEQSPEEFAYNVIPLYPQNDSCAVIVKFKGHTEVNTHAGWRYGFVAAHPNGTISRYSPTYSENTSEIVFSLSGDETKMYLVVMGAPVNQITTNTSNDTWRGYPKHFRFPYELSISGAVPEGHQAPTAFRTPLRTNGHLHANGGGWVQNSATVASSVYVGPMAMVLGNSNVSGTVRIENTAVVRNAVVGGQVQITDNAFVTGGNYSGSARIKGQAFVENATMSQNALVHMRARVSNYNLSGTIEVGGDVVVYNQNGSCNNGVYYRLTNYYDNKLLECDGRTANHTANKDVNNTYSLFSDAQMAFQCKCSGAIVLDNILINAPSCSNPDSGSVAFQLSNTCGAVQYHWTKGIESGNNTSGLSAGAYLFTVSDALGKQLIVPVNITTPSTLSASMSATAYQCATGTGGMVQVQVNNGVLPYQYQWNNGASSATNNNIGPGVYEVIVTDANGCSVTGSASVVISGNLNTDVTSTPISCHDSADGSIAITPVFGVAPFSWHWETGETTSVRMSLGAGNYACTVSDAVGCSANTGISLTAPLPLTATVTTTVYQCETGTGGMVQAQVNNGVLPYQYQWNNGASAATNDNVGPGDYAVIATDANGCSVTGSGTVGIAGNLNTNVTSTPISCHDSADGSIAITPVFGVAPFSWHWETGETNSVLMNLGAGNYVCTVSDAAGCSANTEVSLMAPLPLTTTVTTTVYQCETGTGGMVQAQVNNGILPYQYQWNNGASSAANDNVGPGDYAVTVTDANGCSITDSGTVGLAGNLNFEVETTPTSCHDSANGTLAVVPNNGVAPFVWLWETGETDSVRTNLSGGNYALTFTDALGCVGEMAFFFAAPSPLLLDLDVPTLYCSGDTGMLRAIVVGGTIPYNFLWSTGGTTPQINAGGGDFSLTVTDVNGCSQTQSVEIQSFDPITIQNSVTPSTSSNAADGAIIITDIAGGLPPYTFFWNTTATTQSLLNVPAGDYSLTIIDQAGCVEAFSFQVGFSVAAAEPKNPDFQAMIYPNPSAQVAQLQLDLPKAAKLSMVVTDAQGKLIYSKNIDAPKGKSSLALPEALAAGGYWVKVVDVKGRYLVMGWVVLR